MLKKLLAPSLIAMAGLIGTATLGQVPAQASPDNRTYNFKSSGDGMSHDDRTGSRHDDRDSGYDDRDDHDGYDGNDGHDGHDGSDGDDNGGGSDGDGGHDGGDNDHD